jgi:hypothetical protein
VLDTSAKVQDANVSYPMGYEASHRLRAIAQLWRNRASDGGLLRLIPPSNTAASCLSEFEQRAGLVFVSSRSILY